MTHEDNMSILEVNDLTCSIAERAVLQGATLHLRKGEVLGLIGPNGSGKTTLFNCLSGFIAPQSGSIQLKGQDIVKFPPHLRSRSGLGRVFQRGGLFREMTVFENLQVALENSCIAKRRDFTKTEMKQQIEEYLGRKKLDGREKDRAAALSGGQARLLEMLRLLAFGAEVFLLDEPTAGVSPAMKGEVSSLILSLKQEGSSMIVIEHDLDFIASFCDRIAVLDSGQIVLEGTPDEVRQSSMLQEIYLGTGAAA